MKITQTAQPVHPGTVLQRELDARALTPTQAARAFGVNVAQVRAVLGGGEVTPDLATKVTAAWGIPVGFWGNLQAQFDAHPARHGGARAGAGRPARGQATAQIRVTGDPKKVEAIQEWLAAQGRGNGAARAADVLYEAIQRTG